MVWCEMWNMRYKTNELKSTEKIQKWKKTETLNKWNVVFFWLLRVRLNLSTQRSSAYCVKLMVLWARIHSFFVLFLCRFLHITISKSFTHLLQTLPRGNNLWITFKICYYFFRCWCCCCCSLCVWVCLCVLASRDYNFIFFCCVRERVNKAKRGYTNELQGQNSKFVLFFLLLSIFRTIPFYCVQCVFFIVCRCLCLCT